MLTSRREWEDKSAKLGKAFDVNTAAERVSEDVLRRAKKLHDLLFPVKLVRSNNGTSSSGGAGAGTVVIRG